MVSRRGFLEAMLALGASSFVVSDGVARGVLMPARARLLDPRIEVVGTTGELLCTVRFLEGFRSAAWGPAVRTGVVGSYRVFDAPVGDLVLTPNEFRLDTRCVCAGDTLCLTSVQFFTEDHVVLRGGRVGKLRGGATWDT